MLMLVTMLRIVTPRGKLCFPFFSTIVKDHVIREGRR